MDINEQILVYISYQQPVKNWYLRQVCFLIMCSAAHCGGNGCDYICTKIGMKIFGIPMGTVSLTYTRTCWSCCMSLTFIYNRHSTNFIVISWHPLVNQIIVSWHLLDISVTLIRNGIRIWNSTWKNSDDNIHSHDWVINETIFKQILCV